MLAADPAFTQITGEHVARLVSVAKYRPGAFYERELPAIEAVLRLAAPVRLLVVDGYVDLDPEGRPGLGAHAHERFGIPVIGAAKTQFRGATHAVPVRRRSAIRPLYVTAAGVGVEEAAALVASMTGPHRIPDALKRADFLSRTG